MGPKNFSFQVCVIFWIKRKGIEWTWFQNNLFCKVFFGLPVVKTAQWVPKISLFKFVSFFGSKETESNELGVNITLRNLFPFLPSRSKSNLNPMNWNEPSVKNGMKHSHSFLQDNLKKKTWYFTSGSILYECSSIISRDAAVKMASNSSWMTSIHITSK